MKLFSIPHKDIKDILLKIHLSTVLLGPFVMINGSFSIKFLSPANKDLLKLIASEILGFCFSVFFVLFCFFLTYNTLLALAIKRGFVEILPTTMPGT